MTKHELLKKLVRHYSKHIRFVHSMTDMRTIENYCFLHGIANGICRCAQKIYGEYIYDSDWVKKGGDAGGYWYKLPCMCETKSALVDALEYRLKKMKKLLAK